MNKIINKLSTTYQLPSTKPAFTIVELLVVIVVIAILAAITIVSYTGISSKATVASLQSDLSNAKKQLALYQVEYGSFPASLDANNCPNGSTPADTKYCLKPTLGNTFTYSSPTSPFQSFIMDAIRTGSTIKYRITNNSAPVSAMPTDTVTIGTQTWMQYNLNVGTMITGGTAQTNNSIIEKFCANNDPTNCTIYGGLYQWDEMMQYVTTEGVQGICPTGFHIPTDSEYKTLEMNQGMTQSQADANNWHGTTEGIKLKLDGTSGFNGLLGGLTYGGTWDVFGSDGDFWSSSEYIPNPTASWQRKLRLTEDRDYRSAYTKTDGLSVRCLKN